MNKIRLLIPVFIFLALAILGYAYSQGTASLSINYKIADPITLADGTILQYTPQCLIDCYLPIEVSYTGSLSPISKSLSLSDISINKAKIIGLDTLYKIDFYYVKNNTYDEPYWDSKMVCINITANNTLKCEDQGKLINKTVWGYFLEPLNSITVQKDKYSIIVLKSSRKASINFSTVDIVPNLYGFSMPELAWWNTSWSRKRAINVSVPSGTTPQLYTIAINVSYDSDMNSDFSDLRFVNASENTALDYWIQEKNTAWAYVWIEITENITTTNQTLAYMYYGNPSAATTSNLLTSFMFADDFNRADSATVNNGWIELDGGAGSIETNRLKIAAGGTWGRIYHTVENQTSGIAQGFLYNETVSTSNGMRWDLSANNMFYGTSKSFTIGEGNAGYFGSTPLWTNIVAMTTKVLYRVEARMNQTKVNFTINRTQYNDYAITTAGNCNVMDNISFGEYSGTGYIDDAYVRKFQTPEPTFTIGTEQTSSGGGATSPQYSNVWNNSVITYSPTQTSLFNITWSNGTSTSVVNISAVNFTSNFSGTNTNYNMTFLNGNTNSANFTYSIILPAGVFTWNSSAKSNDTTPALNTSNSIIFTVAQATPVCNLTITPVTPINYETNTTAICRCNTTDSGVTIKLYRNNSDVTTQNNSAVSLPANSYSYVCNSTSTNNFTVGSNSSTYVVNKLNANVQISPATQTIAYRTSVNQYCLDSSSFYVCGLWRNNTLLSNNSNILLASGIYVYDSNITDTSNYSSYSSQTTLNVSKAVPPINFTITPGTTVTEGTDVNISCNYPSEISVNLYNDSSSISNPFIFQTTGKTGTWNYTCNSTATSNYTSGTASQSITVGASGALIIAAVYDEKTLVPLTFNLTIYNSTFSSTSSNIVTYNNATVKGDLTISISASGYVPRNYYVYVSSNSTVSMSGYLLKAIDGVYITYWSFSTNNPTGEYNSYHVFKRFITSSYVTMAESKADLEGKGTMFLDPYTNYVINSETSDGSLIWNSSSYNPNPSFILKISFGGLATGSNQTWLFTKTNYSLTPTDTYLRINVGGNVTQFNYTITDGNNSIEWFSLRLIYYNGTVLYFSNDSTHPSGGTILVNLNYTNLTSYLIAETLMKKTGYSLFGVNRSYIVWRTSSAIPDVLEQAASSGLSLSVLALISVFCSFAIAMVSNKWIRTGSGLIYLAILTIFGIYSMFPAGMLIGLWLMEIGIIMYREIW